MLADFLRSPRAKETAVRASRMLAVSIEERVANTLGEAASSSLKAK